MKKVTTDCCDPDETLPVTNDCLSDITGLISKFIGEVQKFTGEYQLFNISLGVN